MIITTDKQEDAFGYHNVKKDNVHDDAPPTYTSSVEPATSSSSSSSPAGTQATNHVYISRHHGTIKDSFLIDPSLHIPPELLARPVGEPWNLDLEAHHGSVDADVSLCPTRSADFKQASLRVKSQHGGIKLVLHDVENRPPFRLHASSAFGTINLVIPRSFSGPITTTTVHGSVRLSESVNAAMTMFGEVDGTRRCFLGDFARWQGRGQDSDTSDEIVVESRYGGLRIRYEGEAMGTTRRARGGLLGSIFGF